MQDRIAIDVHAIFSYGLSLRDRLEAGEALVPRHEHATIEAMLAPLQTEEVWDANESKDFDLENTQNISPQDQARLSQATIRYALACWLDEFLLQHSAWGARWRDYLLEAALYGRARKKRSFWTEVRYAEIRGDLEALEVLYWCVMLGYRGEWRDRTQQIETWTTRVRGLLEKAAGRPESLYSEAESPPPQAGTLSDLPYRRMVFVALWTFSFLIPAGLLLAWRQWHY